jgi:hypothetical protein
MKALVPLSEVPLDIMKGLDDCHLMALSPLFSSSSTILTANHAQLEAYREALDVLRWVFTLPYLGDPSFTYRYIILHWLGSLSQDFIILLNERRPGALILLAYYCVLLKRAQCCWYIQGHPDRLLSPVHSDLNTDLLIWIEWPLQVTESLGYL